VVRRAKSAVARPECVLTEHGCERLQGDVDVDGTVCLGVIMVEDVVGWLIVEHDWDDHCERHGVFVMPTDVPRTERELRATRFFVNAFNRRDHVIEDEEEKEEDAE